MASPNHSDDIAVLSACVAQLARTAMAGRSPARLGLAAKAAGMTVAQAVMFLDGTLVPAPRQGVALVSALLEEQRVSAASYLAQIRQPGPVLASESTEAGARDAVGALRKDFPDWTVEMPSGWKTLGTDKVKVVWLARRDDDKWADVYAATAPELRAKLELVEAGLAADEKIQKQYRTGGVRR